jgi:hypothetical protein
LSGREAMLCQLLPVPRGTPVQGSNTAFKRGRVEVCLQPEHGTPDKVRLVPMIGIGGHLTAPPLPHHPAYGSRTTAVRSD